MFGELAERDKEQNKWLLMNFRDSQYMTTRTKKGTEISTTWKTERELVLDIDEIKVSDLAEGKGLNNLNEKIVCQRCKESEEQLNEKLVVLNSCNTMITEDKWIRNSDIC